MHGGCNRLTARSTLTAVSPQNCQSKSLLWAGKMPTIYYTLSSTKISWCLVCLIESCDPTIMIMAWACRWRRCDMDGGISDENPHQVVLNKGKGMWICYICMLGVSFPLIGLKKAVYQKRTDCRLKSTASGIRTYFRMYRGTPAQIFKKNLFPDTFFMISLYGMM